MPCTTMLTVFHRVLMKKLILVLRAVMRLNMRILCRNYSRRCFLFFENEPSHQSKNRKNNPYIEEHIKNYKRTLQMDKFSINCYQNTANHPYKGVYSCHRPFKTSSFINILTKFSNPSLLTRDFSPKKALSILITIQIERFIY